MGSSNKCVFNCWWFCVSIWFYFVFILLWVCFTLQHVGSSNKCVFNCWGSCVCIWFYFVFVLFWVCPLCRKWVQAMNVSLIAKRFVLASDFILYLFFCGCVSLCSMWFQAINVSLFADGFVLVSDLILHLFFCGRVSLCIMWVQAINEFLIAEGLVFVSDFILHSLFFGCVSQKHTWYLSPAPPAVPVKIFSVQCKFSQNKRNIDTFLCNNLTVDTFCVHVFRCKFYSPKFCLCKRNDKYEVWSVLPSVGSSPFFTCIVYDKVWANGYIWIPRMGKNESGLIVF